MTARRRLPFVQVDVFSARALEGNALAVFTDARGFTGDEMQALAPETNLSRGDVRFYAVCREAVDRRARLHARMTFYGGEDPATGSAAGCAAAWMVAHGLAASDERVLIEQGLEMRRPSQIFVSAAREGERVTAVRVGGHVVEVMRGEVRL